jgi:enterochelin esterase family protein
MTASNSKILRARESGSPVIDGSEVTFFWDGKTAPTIVGDFNHWDSSATPFKRLSPRLQPASAKSVWYCTLSLPRDAYVEYAFHDPVSQKNFTDPLNKKSISNGMGGRNNFFYMPEGKPSPLTTRRAGMPAGEVTHHRVSTWMMDGKGERTVHLYQPPVQERVPLLIVYDGTDYLRRGKLAVIVDNLIAQKRIQPIAMAFLQNGGRWRSVEYFCSDATLLWLDQEVIPLARRELNLLNVKRHPGAYGVLGASAGGLMSLYTGLRMPEIFGKVLSQSGVSSWEGRDFATVDLVKHKHARDIRIWLDAGKFEWGWLLKDNRRMKSLLKKNGYQFVYREYSGGHNHISWRDDIWRGLEALFPG